MEVHKKILEVSGEFLKEFARISVESMKQTSQKNARNKELTEEQREWFANAAENFDRLGELLTRREEKECFETDQSVVDDHLENRRQDKELKVHPSVSVSRGAKQELLASSETDYGEEPLEEWEKRWVAVGVWKHMDADGLGDIVDDVGLLKFTINDEVVYLIRAIELKRGGIRHKIGELL